MKPQTLLRFYPRQWRERYGDEFLALLEREGTGPRVVLSVMAGAFDAWMSPKTPGEMALDGPFGPGILLERGNADVTWDQRVVYGGAAAVLGLVLYRLIDHLTNQAWVGILGFQIGLQLVMPFLWLRYFSLRTRVAAALWGLAAIIGIPFLVFGAIWIISRLT